MPGKVGIARKSGQGTAAPTFVAHFVYLGGADREGRVFVKEEIATVVVINDDGDVRFDLVQPFLDGFVGVEQGFPVGLVMASLIMDDPDRRYMRCADTGDYFSHDGFSLPCACSVAGREEFLIGFASLMRADLIQPVPDDGTNLNDHVNIAAMLYDRAPVTVADQLSVPFVSGRLPQAASSSSKNASRFPVCTDIANLFSLYPRLVSSAAKLVFLSGGIYQPVQSWILPLYISFET